MPDFTILTTITVLPSFPQSMSTLQSNPTPQISSSSTFNPAPSFPISPSISLSGMHRSNPTSQISPSSISNPAPSLPISPSVSSSGIFTNTSSSTSPQDSSSFVLTSPSAPTQSAVLGIQKTFSAGTTAGLTVGAVATLVSLSTVAFCIWRARRKREPVLPTYEHFPPPEGQQRRPNPMRQKPGTGEAVAMLEPRSPVADIRQQSVATELRTSRQELRRNNDGIILELAMRQNNILEARIRDLERAHMGPPLSDSLPPGYLD
ncbi:hypothetical protein B0H11DRAFT_1036615 [Mycena galericulata]|nr:hypothetical protein B0H11DRAFT_1036615 [Mycena galericulata]